ncbi:MAG TPA: ABC transporter permease [Bacillota bacterium]|nr:ABC transporter permease [Candidatus Fermentithermobacillaceae bacterium]HOB30876.1 ABC transporter permease [Bacillota bacterium]HOK64673.1 ABC transporter permease [Bacillota bacterium]HOL12196.1 ABC transporter permease [Bacillota bacterium]HOQ02234.1 ABC transporter permease [Bacillota bacterium]
MQALLRAILSPSFAASILRVTTPILFAALGAVVADLSGVVNIALEGTMLFSAFTGVAVSAFTQSAWLGLLAAVGVGALVGLTLAYSHLKLGTDAVLAGIALNLLAAEGTVFLLYVVAGDKGVSSSLPSKVLPDWHIPVIKEIPVLGAILGKQNALTYMSLIAVVLVYLFLFKTSFGLRLRAVGENPDAADSVGISVHRVQFVALAISGALAGMGGAHLSMGYVSWFSRNMTSGRGFIALAAETLGYRHPVGVFLASLLFGFADALSNYMQSLRVPGEFVQMIPYLLTLVALTIYSGRQRKGRRSSK